MKFFEEHKRGIIGSGVFHLTILFLLLWFGFFTPLPLPGEQGIMVNFGDSETGLGEEEPSPKQNTPPIQKKEEKEEIEEVPPPPKTTPPKPTPKQPEKEQVMTQDYEKTIAIEASEKKRKEELKKKREAEELERKRLNELERQKQAEIERQRKEEQERQRLAELERQKKEAESKKIAEINSRTKNAFGKSGNGTGGTGNGQGTSQGVTYPGGNQGVPTGSPNANTYGPGGSGSGDKGNGPSYSLAGRHHTSLPKPNYPGNEEGVVVVQITVDKNGNVTKAEAGVRGSNTMNQELLAAARKAALATKFNADNNAAAFQIGTITYRFSLE